MHIKYLIYRLYILYYLIYRLYILYKTTDKYMTNSLAKLWGVVY